MESPRRSTESHITRHHLLNPATLNTYQPILQAEAESLPVSINSTTSQSKDYNRPWISILLTILAGCLFSTCSLIVKSMVDIDPLELAICRYIGLIIPCLPILIWRKEHMFPKGNRLLLVLRSLAGLIDIIISFYVYRHMPLGEVAAIFYSVPVYVTLFAYIFLKEPCGLVNVVTVTVTLTGVLLVTKPVFLFGEISDPSGSKTFENQTFATVAAFVTTIVAANVYVLLRSMKSVHFSVMLGTYGVFALLPLVAVSWYLDVLRLPKSGLEWLNMIILALLSFMAHLSNFLSFKFGNAGLVATVKPADIVLAFVWQIFLFKQFPHYYSVIGAILIIFSVVSVGLRNWILSLPESSHFRKKFRILAM